MNIEIKIPRKIYTQSLYDLRRPHQHAYERVGFIYFRSASNGSLLLATDYEPVADECYIHDETVGARFNSIAIRKVMQRILDTDESAFHVHLHEFFDGQNFSRTDLSSLYELIPSFASVAGKIPHGAILYNENRISSLVWHPDLDKPKSAERVSIIGFPTEIKKELK